MKATIKINLGDTTHARESATYELARILTNLAYKVRESGAHTQELKNIYGNKIGTIEVEE
ncbi:hypothetical protein LCGC14_1467020 [marine sediment metagenome]|uniref:Uncharacterized protein n=1 Tax=marine sediment metagenome TaxID=412755 RepID=A0A0F9JDI3_9ZZZZ